MSATARRPGRRVRSAGEPLNGGIGIDDHIVPIASRRTGRSFHHTSPAAARARASGRRPASVGKSTFGTRSVPADPERDRTPVGPVHQDRGPSAGSPPGRTPQVRSGSRRGRGPPPGPGCPGRGTLGEPPRDVEVGRHLDRAVAGPAQPYQRGVDPGRRDAHRTGSATSCVAAHRAESCRASAPSAWSTPPVRPPCLRPPAAVLRPGDHRHRHRGERNDDGRRPAAPSTSPGSRRSPPARRPPARSRAPPCGSRAATCPRTRRPAGAESPNMSW